MGGWDPKGNWRGWCGVVLPGPGYGPVAAYCEHGDKPSGFGATELRSHI